MILLSVWLSVCLIVCLRRSIACLDDTYPTAKVSEQVINISKSSFKQTFTTADAASSAESEERNFSTAGKITRKDRAFLGRSTVDMSVLVAQAIKKNFLTCD